MLNPCAFLWFTLSNFSGQVQRLCRRNPQVSGTLKWVPPFFQFQGDEVFPSFTGRGFIFPDFLWEFCWGWSIEGINYMGTEVLLGFFQRGGRDQM